MPEDRSHNCQALNTIECIWIEQTYLRQIYNQLTLLTIKRPPRIRVGGLDFSILSLMEFCLKDLQKRGLEILPKQVNLPDD